MKLALLVITILLIFVACIPAPLAITEYKESPCDECLFMAWTTNTETQCSIEYCYNGKCYWTGDSEWGKLHSIIMPDYYELTIWATDKAGNRTSLEVK